MKKKILIFGGSRGLGAQLAAQWKQKDYEVVCPTREECDLSNKKSLEAYLSRTAGAFHSIVYCAGYSAAGKVTDVPLEEYERCYQVNFFSPLHILKYFIKHSMPPASFVVVLTGATEFLMPGISAYALSKRALRDLIQYLRAEGVSLNVQVVYPGGMKTQFDQKTPIYGGYSLPLNPRLKDPAQVAEKIIQRVETGKGGVMGFSPLFWLVGFFQMLFPEMIGSLLRRQVGDKA